MKQHITRKQLNELSDKGKGKLREWWKPEEGDFLYDFSSKEADVVYGYGYDEENQSFCNGTDAYEDNNCRHELKDCLPLLSIGQMIEFLVDNKNGVYGDSYIDGTFRKVLNVTHLALGWNTKLCDDLWGEVKEVLNKD